MNISDFIHDAEIFSVENYILDGAIKLKFRKDEAYFDLSFNEVLELRCVDFGRQNVVLELISTSWQKIEADELKKNIGWIYSRDGGEILLSEEKIENIVNDVVGKKYHFFMIIPSWGAQIGILAKNFILDENNVY